MSTNAKLLSIMTLVGLTGCQAPGWSVKNAPKLSAPSGLSEIKMVAKGIE